MANLIPKIPADVWVATAREALVDEGIEAVKVGRLAERLGVTRGGFYHHFEDRAALLDRLLETWQERVVFVPRHLRPSSPSQALDAIDALLTHLLDEADYDPRFDLAVRAWAQADERVASAVKRADRKRIAALKAIFDALGCGEEEASIRARVFYFHQIGYYAIGIRESREDRQSHLDTYTRILCGDQNLEAARRSRK